MEEFLKRANQADDLLKTLTARVAALEKKGGSGAPSAVASGKMVLVDPDSEAMTEKARNKIRAAVLELQADCAKAEKKNAALEAENKKLKAEIKRLKQSGGGSSSKVTQQMQQELAKQQGQKNPLDKIKESLKKWREDVVELTKERDDLKKQVESGAAGGGMTQEMHDSIKSQLMKIREEVVKYMKQQGEMVEAVGGSSSQGEKMTMDTIKDLKYYNVTTNLQELKTEWEEADLGPLDDEDFELYLGRKVRVIEIEEDDDTCNVRFDNHDTQWFPVGCLYTESEAPAASKPEASAPAASSGGLVQMTMDTIKERKYYFVTKDLGQLKKAWDEAELGELDDEDYQLYLGRKVYAIDLEEDDDTMNVRFDNHDTQWFPVSCLYMQSEAAPAPKPQASSSGLVQMTMDTIKERKYYFVTKDLGQLKKAWEEAELGELDDEDYEIYLGRKVYAIDLEEDDDTMNVRFDNHDTQWFPVSCLYSQSSGSKASSPNGSRKQMTMDTIKERKNYFVTKDLKELKKAWMEAELGELDDEDFQIYLGRKVYAIDLEEDDDTMNVRFDNHDTQWFPVSTLYEE